MQTTNRRSVLQMLTGAATAPAVAAASSRPSSVPPAQEEIPNWEQAPIAEAFAMETNADGLWTVLRRGNQTMRFLVISNQTRDILRG